MSMRLRWPPPSPKPEPRHDLRGELSALMKSSAQQTRAVADIFAAVGAERLDPAELKNYATRLESEANEAARLAREIYSVACDIARPLDGNSSERPSGRPE